MSVACGFCLGSEDTEYTSADFCGAFRTISGDGVTPYGRRFSVLPNGFTLTVGTGYGLAAGRYIHNDDSLRLAVSTPKNNADRTDAIVLRVDYAARNADIEILPDVKPDILCADPSPIRNEETYSVVLYFVRVRRGATYVDANDITDMRANDILCGSVYPLSTLTAGVLRAYNYFRFGIDAKLSVLDAAVDKLISQTDTAAQALEQKIQSVGAANTLGSLETARSAPEPHEEWLLCDGGTVPSAYPALSLLLTGKLPELCHADDRYKTYIYGGAPRTVTVRKRG